MVITADTITDELASPTVADIEAAFDDGRLYTLVDESRRIGHSSFVGSHEFKWDDSGVIVHVISKPSGGEIRGYVRINGELRLRLPCTPIDWPELDEVVSRRLGLSVKAVRP